MRPELGPVGRFTALLMLLSTFVLIIAVSVR